jgi:two-component system, response regulator, stage 0 sporulation protein A
MLMQAVRKDIIVKKSIRLVVVDSSEEVTSSIKKYFEGNELISVVSCVSNGVDALNYLTNCKEDYDMVVMDLLLPQMDGMTVLENIHNRKLNKKVIVLSNYKEDYTIKKLVSLGVKYYILKPFSLDSLEKRIVDLNQEYDSVSDAYQNVEVKISEMLHNLGVPSHIRGYQYIRDGIVLIYSNDKYVNFITKEIYPNIAKKYDTTSSRVERAIRHAIEISWDRGDVDLMEDLFGHSVSFDRSKPTNSEYLNTIADRLRLTNSLVVS